MEGKPQIVGNSSIKSNNSKKSIHYFYDKCYFTYQMERSGTVTCYTWH